MAQASVNLDSDLGVLLEELEVTQPDLWPYASTAPFMALPSTDPLGYSREGREAGTICRVPALTGRVRRSSVDLTVRGVARKEEDRAS